MPTSKLSNQSRKELARSTDPMDDTAAQHAEMAIGCGATGHARPAPLDRPTAAEIAVTARIEGATTEAGIERRSRLARWFGLRMFLRHAAELMGLAEARAHAEEHGQGSEPKMPLSRRIGFAGLALAEVVLIQGVLVQVLQLRDPTIVERAAAAAMAGCLVPIGHVVGEALRDVVGPDRQAQLVAALGGGMLVTVLSAVAMARTAVETTVGLVSVPPWVLGVVGAAPTAAAVVLAAAHRVPTAAETIHHANNRALRILHPLSVLRHQLVNDADRVRWAQQVYAWWMVCRGAAANLAVYGPDPRSMPDFRAFAHSVTAVQVPGNEVEWEALVARVRLGICGSIPTPIADLGDEEGGPAIAASIEPAPAPKPTATHAAVPAGLNGSAHD